MIKVSELCTIRPRKFYLHRHRLRLFHDRAKKD